MNKIGPNNKLPKNMLEFPAKLAGNRTPDKGLPVSTDNLRPGPALNKYPHATPEHIRLAQALSTGEGRLDPFGGADKFFGRIKSATIIDKDTAELVVGPFLEKAQALRTRTLNLADTTGTPLFDNLLVHNVTEGKEKTVVFVVNFGFDGNSKLFEIAETLQVNTLDWPSPFMREVFASYNSESIRVYQAFNNDIADSLISSRDFGPSFSRHRYTWIKPSFNWLMKRSGWASKADQERILGIDIKRSGFEELLDAARITTPVIGVYHPDEKHYRSEASTKPNLVQWDPDRDYLGRPIHRRAIQIGISPKYRNFYLDLITGIEDVTGTAEAIRKGKEQGMTDRTLFPFEYLYRIPDSTRLMLEAGEFNAGEHNHTVDYLSALTLPDFW